MYITCWGRRKFVRTFSPENLSVSGLSWTRGLVWFSDNQMAVMVLSLTKERGRCGMLFPARLSTAMLVMCPTSRGILVENS